MTRAQHQMVTDYAYNSVATIRDYFSGHERSKIESHLTPEQEDMNLELI